ncbi:hypothetical protein NBRC116188_24800 [Oceaniserpentilla sp. 4NH20-0058]|uniref:response regulator n=1 Tax=Oceaniserpentilla sp. 4NH20-0058 TaxID=3127660 RepID=UPI0031037B25
MAKTSTKSTYKVLVVSDDKFDAEEVIRLIRMPLLKIEHALNDQKAIEQFDRNPFDLIVLSHSDVSIAHSFYMNFLMQSKKALDYPHQVILMCDGKEISSAYKLCKEQYLDDYVVYKPLYDVYGAKFSLEKSIERLDLINYKTLIENRIKKILSQMEDIKFLIKEQSNNIKQEESSAVDKSDELEVIIKQGFEHLKSKISDSDIAKEHKDSLSQQCDEIKKTTVDEGLEQHKKEIEKLGQSWMDEMLGQFKDEPEEIKEETEVKVLIVEDELVNQKVMSLILTEEGFITKVASDGEEGYLLIKKWQPDVVLMDIRMPKMNGLKVVKKLKESGNLGEVIIIMLTAHSEKVVVNECLKSGASDFIVKPAKRDVLLERINHFLELRG